MEQFFRQFDANYQPHTKIHLSQSAIVHNFYYLQQLYEAEYVIPVLKANAYGHGLSEITQILEEAEIKVPYIAVDSYQEALQVRALSDYDVLVMGAVLPQNFTRIDVKHITYVIQDISALSVLSNQRRTTRIHLEFDTGLNRQGFSASEVKDIIPLLKDNPQIQLDGVMSHFYDSNSNDRSSLDTQVERFDAIVARIKKAGFDPPYIHIAKTTGMSETGSQHTNAIRIGAGLYGLNLLDQNNPIYAQFEPLRPVLRLTSSIIKQRTLNKDEGVGYGHTYRAPQDGTVIGVVPFGYADGLPPELGNSGSIVYRTTELPIVGTVAMNHIAVNLTDVKAGLWKRVEIISSDIESPASLRHRQQTNNIYPLRFLASLSPDIRRVIVD
jgi:alanine racemase